jgi:hypothetical protein
LKAVTEFFSSNATQLKTAFATHCGTIGFELQNSRRFLTLNPGTTLIVPVMPSSEQQVCQCKRETVLAIAYSCRFYRETHEIHEPWPQRGKWRW